MKPIVRIGTRKSPLALIQAQKVAEMLSNLQLSPQIVPIDSDGDTNLIQPIYSMGITGVFTKNLDRALLNNTIDVAVHSLKDIPTLLPNNVVLSAVLERDFDADVMVWNPKSAPHYSHAKIGTGSLRRIAFLKNLDPTLECFNIRGNVATRLQKMESEPLNGVVFSLAGLKRLNIEVPYELIPGMIPAAGQGVIAITTLKGKWQESMQLLTHAPTQKCIQIEREFLHYLEGGCTAPIGAIAYFDEKEIVFKGGICSLNGQQRIEIDRRFSSENIVDKGRELAEELKALGGNLILKSIQSENG